MAKQGTKLTRRLEDYLESVLILVRRNGVARVSEIAAATNVNKSSVTAALKHLAEDGLVNHDPYQFVTLTPLGKSLAEKVLDKHKLLTVFLIDVLNIDATKAEENACRMEHVVDDVVLERISMLAEFIQDCPQGGSKWMKKFLAYCEQHQSPETDAGQTGSERSILKTTMDQIKPGQTGKILKVGGSAVAARRRLMDMGVTPGTPFEVKRVAPLGDPIEIRIRKYHLTLRKSEAAGITVEPTEE
ncbi:MAG: metal-dependent transcriptional regulator [Phycisphaerae bacterium]|nr:metal-dependent transcriptional regulator [Phycisphaerae bacterium]